MAVTDLSGVDVDALFACALELHRKGAFLAVETVLTQILEREPGHFDAWHLRGVVASQLNRHEQAVESLQFALRLNDRLPAVHRHLGNALRHLGRLDEAAHCYGRAIECRADYKEAYVNRAMTWMMLRRPAAALEDLDRAVTLGAHDSEVHSLRASALIDLRRPLEAVVSAEEAIALWPGDPNAHVSRAIGLYLLARYAEAVASCDRALGLDAGHASAHAHRGAALYAMQQLEAAQVSLDRAIALEPTQAFAHAVRALCSLDAQQTDAALACCDRAIELRADMADAYNTRGLALADLGRFDEALQSFERAIALDPRASEPYFNKGIRHLLRGEFAAGWELYEHRPRRAAHPAVAVFDGSQELAGKTIWVYSEQGLGDTLHMCRYVKLLEALGARVILSAQDCLRALLQTLGATVEVVGPHAVPSSADLQCALLSLPRAFQTRLESIPADVPYLHADPGRVALWRVRLRGPRDPRRLIGIRWQGSTGRADSGRSFPVRLFERIAAIPDVRLVSLQKHAGEEQLRELPPSCPIEELGSLFEPGGPDAFLDMAAVMQCLDLVITSDTSVAHLAGALARPTWVALKNVPDWRWMLDREDSPWYPTMRLFRQSRPGDWPGVFARMHAQLVEGAGQQRARASRFPLMSSAVSILVLLGTLAATQGWAQSRTAVPLPTLQSDPPNTVLPEDAAVDLGAGHVSVELSVNTAEESPALLLESPFFGGSPTQDAYPDPEFPELSIRDDGAPSPLEDRFEAFMGSRNITQFLKLAGMDPWAVTRTPPTTSAHPKHPQNLKALSNIDAIEKSGDDYVAKWTVRRIIRIPLKPVPRQHVALDYSARPAISVLTLAQVDTTAREKRYCLSPESLRRLPHAAKVPSMLSATEYIVATGIDGKPPNSVTVTMSSSVDPAMHASTYFFLCGPHGKPIAKKNTVARERAEVDDGGTLYVLALTESAGFAATH